jgi:hypothetical protein
VFRVGFRLLQTPTFYPRHRVSTYRALTSG